MNKLTKNIKNLWGRAGEQWLQSLPTLVEMLARQWNLRDLQVLPHLTYHYVLAGYRNPDHLPIVLKLGFDPMVAQQEIAALQFYQGRGCAKLIDFDRKHNALLIERIIPGASMKTLFPQDDEQAIQYAANIMRQLHAVPLTTASSFHYYSDWLADLNAPNKLPEQHRYKAHMLAYTLLKTAEKPVLLHADLHHDNILLSERDHALAIDPKGIIGESAIDAAAFIHNPIAELVKHPEATRIIARRIALFSSLLNIDADRIKKWSYIHAVLAAHWTIEDDNNPQQLLKLAELIQSF